MEGDGGHFCIKTAKQLKIIKFTENIPFPLVLCYYLHLSQILLLRDLKKIVF